MKSSLNRYTAALAVLISMSATTHAADKDNNASQAASDLTITVTPVSESKGQLMLAVYDSELSFRKESVRAISQPAVTGDMTVTISKLPHGTYAVMVFQDLNENGKLDANLMGMPKEPWGGSLQGKTVFGAPGWSDTRFDLSASENAITINLY
jgi:uncharacterized protein (DUF2141 family)